MGMSLVSVFNLFFFSCVNYHKIQQELQYDKRLCQGTRVTSLTEAFPFCQSLYTWCWSTNTRGPYTKRHNSNCITSNGSTNVGKHCIPTTSATTITRNLPMPMVMTSGLTIKGCNSTLPLILGRDHSSHRPLLNFSKNVSFFSFFYGE